MTWWYQNKSALPHYFTMNRFLFTTDVATSNTRWLKYTCEGICFYKVMAYSLFLYQKTNSLQIFSRTLPELSKLLFWRASLMWLLLLLDNNIRYYERCVKENPPKQFSSNKWQRFTRNWRNLKENSSYRANACSP